MPFADTSLHEEYCGAVEWVASRTLDALTGVESAGPAGAGSWTDRYSTKALLAAIRVLGPDVLAPQSLARVPVDVTTANLVGQSLRTFPAEGTDAGGEPGGEDKELVVAWRDWATAELLFRHGHGTVPPRPERSPVGAADVWQTWSVRMSQLSCLALPGLTGAVHDSVAREVLALSRGAARAMMRRDVKVAARLARWLAWLEHTGRPSELAAGPILRHLDLMAGGSARTALDIAIGHRLLATGE
jgi:hypothetical protein